MLCISPYPKESIMSDANQAASNNQAKRDELLKKFHADPIAFLRLLANARTHNGDRPAPGTHLLTWTRGHQNDKTLYAQEIIDELLDYILMLEEQLAIDAAEFRTKSINSIITNHHLDGFTKV
jgi:hypothetical protein